MKNKNVYVYVYVHIDIGRRRERHTGGNCGISRAAARSSSSHCDYLSVCMDVSVCI